MDILSFEPLVLQLADLLRAKRWRIATAESCTGGLIAAVCTTVAGSSDWFERGFVTYSNEAKMDLLGVPAGDLAAHGAVSEPVATAMARGAMRHAPVDLAVAVTGIAGPGGAVPGKPVGTVWMALAGVDNNAGTVARTVVRPGEPTPPGAYTVQTTRLQLSGDRAAVRAATVHAALQALIAAAR